MTFSTYYDSNDTGLGGVTNTAGSMVAFLDKVLVSGYNSKTLTSMTQVGTLVTATLTSHGYRDLQFVTISGVTPSGYNGTWQIVNGSSTLNTFQFNTVTSGMGAATGTIGCIVAPLSGWTNPFTGTNLRAYQAGSGNRLFLYVDDTGTTSARMNGFEKMTDISLTYAVNSFPLTAQLSGGIFSGKASAAATRRTILWGNGTTIYLFNDYAGDSSTCCFTMFGDFPSYKAGDVWATMMIGPSTLAAVDPMIQFAPASSITSIPATAGHYAARSFSQLPGSIPLSKMSDLRFSTSSTGNSTSIAIGGSQYVMPYPANIDGNLWISSMTLSEPNSGPTPRGILPGITAPMHNRPLPIYTIFTGSAGGAGKIYMMLYGGAIGTNNIGCFLAEISNTW